ncbi:MAG: isocitrate lyase/phosphoenolpyruvate mutase family protein [Deltaproteobacteria bacterium]|nr:isocitrate lyase/phosphoenolpyruvate mutase family protein [Deltaproteobacteria bacterium]
MTTTQSDRAKHFEDLHRTGTFVLPNAWDAASAAVIAAAGAKAIATTSSGISWSLGVPDGEELSRDDMMAAIARIARAVDVPVSGDAEAGYGPSPKDVATTVEALIDAGAVGANLEDRQRAGGDPLFPLDAMCERIAAARAVADRRGIGFVLNARTDVFLASVGDPAEREEKTLERGEAFKRAGADSFFVPGLADVPTIARIVSRSSLPVNILLSAGGPTIAQLAEVGVRRISAGGAVASISYAAAQHAAKQLLEGDTSVLATRLGHMEMQKLMSRR